MYTFSNDSKGCYSVIDYICISASLTSSVTNYDIVQSPYNFSDHEPVEIILNRPTPLAAGSDNNNDVNHGKCASNYDNHGSSRFRFDHCNLQSYYDYTRILLDPIANELNNVYNGLDYNRPIHELCSNGDIERWYSAIVNALLHASHECVPYTKANVYKEWWDENLNTLKHNCMKSHQEWLGANKPRWGPIFEKRNVDKRLYRDLIKSRKLEAKQNISDSLLHSLYNAKT